MAKVKDWLEGIPSSHTRKSYKNGIKKFEEFYGKGIETLIKSENAGKVIEKFYVWLKEKGYTQNSCRNLVNARALKDPSSANVPIVVISTSTFFLS